MRASEGTMHQAVRLSRSNTSRSAALVGHGDPTTSNATDKKNHRLAVIARLHQVSQPPKRRDWARVDLIRPDFVIVKTLPMIIERLPPGTQDAPARSFPSPPSCSQS